MSLAACRLRTLTDNAHADIIANSIAVVMLSFMMTESWHYKGFYKIFGYLT